MMSAAPLAGAVTMSLPEAFFSSRASAIRLTQSWGTRVGGRDPRLAAVGISRGLGDGPQAPGQLAISRGAALLALDHDIANVKQSRADFGLGSVFALVAQHDLADRYLAAVGECQQFLGGSKGEDGAFRETLLCGAFRFGNNEHSTGKGQHIDSNLLSVCCAPWLTRRRATAGAARYQFSWETVTRALRRSISFRLLRPPAGDVNRATESIPPDVHNRHGRHIH
jgi:hypothetical protein